MADLTVQNLLLTCLSAAERHRVLRHAEAVTLRHHTELYAAEGRVTHVYFPLTLVASMLIGAGEGTEVEVATVGKEGMLGSAVVLGVTREIGRTVVQVSGRALRLPVETLEELLTQLSPLQSLLARYQFVLLRQMAQVGACHRLHSIEARCARWLLMTHDRVGRDTFVLTQQYLAKMLGVRRATVGLVLGSFRRAGLLTYVRGHLHLLDRAGLEALACPCYAIINAEYYRFAVEEST